MPVYFSVIKATLFEAVGNVYFKKDWSLKFKSIKYALGMFCSEWGI